MFHVPSVKLEQFLNQYYDIVLEVQYQSWYGKVY